MPTADGDENAPQRRWPRAAGVAGLFVLAGALINVAVAWGIAVLVEDPNKSHLQRHFQSQTELESWVARVYGKMGVNWAWSVRLQFPPWHPMWATGPPDTPIAGDHVTAWASSEPNLENEWIEVSYARPIKAVEVRVYESHETGALRRIDGITAEGQREELWSGTDPTPVGKGIGVSRIRIEPSAALAGIRLTLASAKVDGFNEIDAVGLIDEYGDQHWPTSAIASSTFATHIAANNLIAAEFVRGDWIRFRSRGTNHLVLPPPQWMNLNEPRAAYRVGDQSHEFIMRFSTGWPLRTFAAEYELSVHDGTMRHLRGGIPLSANLSTVLNLERALPLIPIWRGLIANSMLYTSLIWVILFAQRSVIGRHRTRRGRCPMCGYDLRGAAHSRCSECGRILKKPMPVDC